MQLAKGSAKLCAFRAWPLAAQLFDLGSNAFLGYHTLSSFHLSMRVLRRGVKLMSSQYIRHLDSQAAIVCVIRFVFANPRLSFQA